MSEQPLMPPRLTGQAALQQLLEGNRRYVAYKQLHPGQGAARRQEVALEQRPIAAILGCSSSRVPAEIIFDQGLGDLFVVRVGGMVVGEGAALASIEFAVVVLEVPLVLVLGHERCSAVEQAIREVDGGQPLPGQIGHIIARIKPAVAPAREQGGNLVDQTSHIHVANTVAQLREAGPLLTERVQAGSVLVAGAYYDLETGLVEMIGDYTASAS